MCGRLTLTTDDYASVARELEAHLMTEEGRPRWNVSPGQTHLILRTCEDGRRLEPAMWGFGMEGRLLVNARGETLNERPRFRKAFARTRCVVVADGFFEWTRTTEQNQPFFFHRGRQPRPDGLLLLAGLFERVADEDANLRFTIVTTDASPDVSGVHGRMPVILRPEDLPAWLGEGPPSPLAPLLAVPEGGLLHHHPVSPKVNSPSFDRPSAIEPARPQPTQTTLF